MSTTDSYYVEIVLNGCYGGFGLSEFGHENAVFPDINAGIDPPTIRALYS
jgi:hypothetical protein